MTTFRARIADERGIAIVVVMLVMLVLTSLSITIAQLSTFEASGARKHERYYQAFQGAEQGIADYLAVLPTTAGGTSTTGLCALNNQTVSIGTTPPRSYRLTIALYDASGAKVGCTGPNYLGQSGIKQALITSLGSAGSPATTRMLQEKVNLEAIYGSGVNKAMYGGRKVIISNNVDVGYNDQTNDADIYSNGDVVVTNYLDLQGSIYAQGNVTFKGCIEGNIHAKGNIVGGAAYIGACGTEAQPGAEVLTGVNIYPGWGNVTSSEGNITFAPGAWAYGTCTTKTGQSDSHSYCSNQRKPAKPNTPAQCGDAVTDPAEPCGVKLATVPAPPLVNYPLLSFNPTNWTNEGYHIHTYLDCGDAISDFQDYLLGVTPSRQSSGTAWTAATVASGKHVFDVNVNCAFAPSNGTTYTLKGDVAVMLRGATTASINMPFAKIDSAGGGPYTMFFETPWADHFKAVDPTWTNTAAIAAKCGVQDVRNATVALQPYNHRYGTKTDFSGIRFFDYTPCDILSFNQNKSGNGQFIAGEFLYINNSFSLGYYPIDNPDVAPTGYTPQPIFVREVTG